MADSCKIQTSDRKFNEVGFVAIPNRNYRPAPMVAGEEGERLQKVVWGEVLEQLNKELPKVSENS